MFRSRVFNAVLFLLIAFSFAVLGYFGFDWWKTAQRKRQLFVYFQKDSPVTQRIPKDAIAYLNLFDFKRVHASIQGTKLNDTLAHWIDTELSGNHTPNPLLGGVVEKTILNVIGEEFGVAVLPPINNKPQLFAVARLAPGSDLFVGLALANNRKMKKTRIGEDTIYALPSGHLNLGDLYLLLKSGYAYAATDLQRIEAVLKGNSGGPAFLQDLDVHQIPEDTFVFIETKKHELSAILHGNSKSYKLEASSDSLVRSCIPPIPADSAVLKFQTNAPEIFGQPSASFALQSNNGVPSSRFAFSFSSSEAAHNFESAFLRNVNYEKKETDNFENSEVQCYPMRIDNEDLTFCSKGRTYLIAEPFINLKTAAAGIQEVQVDNLPVTIRLGFDSESLTSYQKKVVDGDWSEFSKATAFYFLSCLKSIRGGIDGNNHEILVEIR
jgi:hypothetical protein